MSGASRTSRTARAKLAYATRTYGPESHEVASARRDFSAARIEDHVRELLAKAPPLTSEQRERIAALLRVGPRPQAEHADLGLVDVDHDAIGGDVE